MEYLGPLELRTMAAIREGAPASVQEIVDRLSADSAELAYTTVLTVVSRLHEKGLLAREKDGRRYLYSPAKRVDAGRQGFLERVRGALFGSERLAPVVALLDAEEGLSDSELAALKRLVDERIAQRKSGQKSKGGR